MEKSLGQKRPSPYNVISQLLIWDQSFSNLVQLFFSVCSNLHCPVILIAFQLQFIATSGHDTLSSFLKDFSRILSLIEVPDFDRYQNAIYLGVALISIYMLIFLAPLLYSFYKYWRRGQFARRNIALCIIFGQFHLAFGFWIINAFLMDFIKRGNDDSETGILAVMGVLIIFNYLVAFFVGIFSYDPFLSSNLLSCHSPIFQILAICFKAIAAPIIFLDEGSEATQWCFTIISMLIFIGKLSYLAKEFPYYHYSIMKMALLSSMLGLLFAFSSFLALTNASEHFQTPKVLVYIEVLLIPLACGIATNWLNKMTNADFSIFNNEKSTWKDAIKALFVLRHLIDKVGSRAINDEIQVILEVKFYRACNKDFIPPNNYERKRDLEMNEIFKEFFEQMIIKFEHSELLRIMMVNMSLKDNSAALESTMLHLMELSRIQGKTKLITLKLSQKLQRKVTSFFQNNKDKILDLNQFLEHEDICNKMDYAVQKHIKYYLNFWNSYLKQNIQVRDFYLQSKEIEKNSDYIEGLWRSRIESDKILAGSLYQLYTAYLFHLRASPFRSQIVSKKFAQYQVERVLNNNLMEKNDFTNEGLTDGNVFSIHASMGKEGTAKIIEVSTNFKLGTGWGRVDAVGRNINLLIPKFMVKGHQKSLTDYMKRMNFGGGTKSMFKTIQSHFLHHDGHLIPCDLYLSLHPVVQETPVYIVFIRVNNNPAGNVEKLLLNKEGRIEGFTEEIGHFLKLKNKVKTCFEEICERNFEEILLQEMRDPMESRFMALDFRPLSKKYNARTYPVSISPYPYGGEIYYILSITHQKILKHGESKKIVCSQPDIEEEEDDDYSDLLVTEENEKENPQEGRTLPSFVPIFSFRNNTERQEYLNAKDSKEMTTQFDSSPRKTTRDIKGPTTTEGKDDMYSYDTFMVSTNRNLLNKKTKDQLLMRKKTREKFYEAASSIGSNTRHSMTKFERVLLNIPKNPKLKLIYLSFIFLMVLSGLALVVFDMRNDSTLDQVHGSEEVVSNTIFRLTSYTDIFAYYLDLWQATIGLVDSDKYAQYGLTITAIDWGIAQATEVLTRIRDTNKNIQDYVPKLDQKLVTSIYNDLVPVYDRLLNGTIAVVREDNLFDLSIEIIASGNRFLNSGLPFDEANPYLYFVLNNTMNEPLLANEREVPLMLENNEISLNTLKKFIYANIGITFVIAVSIFGFFVRIVREFQRERDQFIIVFSNISEKHINEQLYQVENLQNILAKTKEKYGLTAKLTSSVVSKPVVSLRGINRVPYLLYLALGGFLLVICSAFPIIAGGFNRSSNKILNNLSLMTRSNLNLYNLVYYWNTIYAYAQIGVSEYAYVKNKPINEGIVDAYENVLGFQDFIVNVLLSKDSDLAGNEDLYNTAIGNICELYPSDDEVFMSYCQTMAGGAATKGILGLHTYYVVGLHSVQQCYNMSSKTWNDSKRCLGMQYIVDAEVIYPCLYWAYENIDGIIKKEALSNYNWLKRFVKCVVGIYITGYVLIGSVVGWRILKKMNDEMTDWRKMIRQLPFPMGKENKFLKVFIQKNRNNV